MQKKNSFASSSYPKHQKKIYCFIFETKKCMFDYKNISWSLFLGFVTWAKCKTTQLKTNTDATVSNSNRVTKMCGW